MESIDPYLQCLFIRKFKLLFLVLSILVNKPSMLAGIVIISNLHISHMLFRRHRCAQKTACILQHHEKEIM